MDSMKNLERLPVDVKNKLLPYFESFIKLHNDNVVSVFVYGSATGGNYIPGISDINTCVVLKTLDFQALKKSLLLVSKGIGKKIVAPLLLTKHYIETSLDVFPIEFLEMLENHIVIYGEDLLSGMEIKGQNIRFICEQQIKGKLIRIRQAYLEIGLKRRGIEALLKESLSSLIPIFRSLLRLKGKQPSMDKVELLNQLCDEFDLDRDVFIQIYKDKSNDEKIGSKYVEFYLDRYITQIQRLTQIVDEL